MNLAPQYSGSIYSYPSPDFFNKIDQNQTSSDRLAYVVLRRERKAADFAVSRAHSIKTLGQRAQGSLPQR
jgi:hypothetical protein